MRHVYEVGDLVKWSIRGGVIGGAVRRVVPALAAIRIGGVTVGGATPCASWQYRIARAEGAEVVKSHSGVMLA